MKKIWRRILVNLIVFILVMGYMPVEEVFAAEDVEYEDDADSENDNDETESETEKSVAENAAEDATEDSDTEMNDESEKDVAESENDNYEDEQEKDVEECAEDCDVDSDKNDKNEESDLNKNETNYDAEASDNDEDSNAESEKHDKDYKSDSNKDAPDADSETEDYAGDNLTYDISVDDDGDILMNINDMVSEESDKSIIEEEYNETYTSYVASGMCGDSLSWTLDKNGLLTISGDGSMTDISWEAYKDAIHAVVIEPGTKNIYDNAFSDCENMQSISIPNSVYKIGKEAFDSCGLLTVDIPTSVMYIEASAFHHCLFLKELVVPDSVLSIGDYAFSGNWIEHITVSNNITMINYGTFAGSNISEFRVPGGVKEIRDSAFEGCNKLERIIIPKSVKGINCYAFNGCEKLKDIYFTGTKEEWSKIKISSLGMDEFSQADIHFNYNGESEDSISFLFIQCMSEVEGINYSETDGYNEKSLELETIIRPLLNLDNDYVTYENVRVKVELPDGLSFSEDQNVSEREYEVGTMDEINHNDFDVVDTVYISKDDYVEQFEIIASLTADGYTNNLTTNTVISVNKVSAVDFTDFNPYIYQADYLSNDEPTREYIIDVTNQLTPCEEICNGISSSDAKIIELWRNGVGMEYVANPTSNIGTGYTLSQEDIYFGVIMDIIKTSEKDGAFDAYMKAQGCVKNIEKQYKTISKDIKMSTRIDSLTSEQKASFDNILSAAFPADDDYLDMDWEEKSILVIDAATTVGDAVSMMQNTYILYELHADSKRALYEMRDYAEGIDDNEYLLGALDRAIYYMNEDPVVSNTYIAGKYGAEYVVELSWNFVFDRIKEASPGAAAFMMSYKTSKWVMNTLLNTDKIVASEVECVIMYELTEAFDAACLHSMNVYSNNRTEENARTLLAMTKLMYRAHLVNCDKAIALCKSVDNNVGPENWYNASASSLVRSLLQSAFPELSHAEQIQHIKNIKEYNNEGMQMSLVAWVEGLNETHPDTGLYEYYQGEIEKAMERACKHIYEFACPVEVSVESPLGNSFVGEEKLHAEDDVVVVLKGDQKIVYTLTDDDYEITLSGTSDGTMDSKIWEIDSDGNQIVLRSYFDVPLSDDMQYEVKATYVDNDTDTNRILFESGSEAETYNSELNEKHTVSVENGYLIVGENICYGDIEIAENEEVTLVACVPYSAEFVGWKLNGNVHLDDAGAASTVIKMGNEDITITALYREVIPTYKISASAGAGGYIALDGEVIVNEGGSQEFMIIPNEGYVIKDVKVDGVSVGNVSSYKFENVIEDHEIVAEFYEGTFILGDINGDAKVNTVDRIYLARYLAGWSGYELTNEAAADVNNDNTVDFADRIYLARYLAGWSGYELE